MRTLTKSALRDIMISDLSQKKDDKMIIEKNCYEILTALENAGFSAYLVGGCVRDALMGLPFHDYDTNPSADRKLEVSMTLSTLRSRSASLQRRAV